MVKSEFVQAGAGEKIKAGQYLWKDEETGKYYAARWHDPIKGKPVAVATSDAEEGGDLYILARDPRATTPNSDFDVVLVKAN